MMNLIYLISGLGSLFTVVWSIPFLLLNYINIKLFTSTSKQKYNIIKKLIKGASIWNEDEPEGIIYGYWFIGTFSSKTENNGKTHVTMYIITSLQFLNSNELIAKIDDESDDESDDVIVDKADKPKTVDNTEISLWERDGGYYRFRYNCIKSVMEYNPRTNQVIAIDKITTHIKNNVNTVVLLSGDPGTGKSMIPLLIAKQLGYSCLDTFNPTDTGDSMVNLFNIVNPTKKKKLIIVLEEVDGLIMNIHNKTIKPHKEVPIPIKDKQGWNTFFDKIDKNIYQNIVIIMTSNKEIDFFHQLDPSYMREGRISMNLVIE